jgi:hypothetical protein
VSVTWLKTKFSFTMYRMLGFNLGDFSAKNEMENPFVASSFDDSLFVSSY